MSRVPSIIQGLPDDLLTNDVTYIRRQKVSAEPSSISASYNEKLFSISASYSIQAGNSVALNISPSSSIVITKAATNDGLPISIYSSHATGSADGIFQPSNMNICSVDETPTTSQLFYAVTPQGNKLDTGYGIIQSSVVACESNTPSVVVKNTSGSTQVIDIYVQFEEIGPRSPAFGLTASTELEPNTEMSNYG